MVGWKVYFYHNIGDHSPERCCVDVAESSYLLSFHFYNTDALKVRLVKNWGNCLVEVEG